MLKLKKVFFFLVLIISIQSIAGEKKEFSTRIHPIYSKTLEGNLNSQIIFLADQLENNINKKYKKYPVVITTFVNLDNLKKTGQLGRLIAESLQHELVVRNWNIVEIKLADKIYMNKKGEFVLSRNTCLLKSNNVDVKHIITGTYTVVGDAILINAKLIRYTDGKILSSAQAVIPYGDYVQLLDEKEESTIKIVSDDE